MRFVLLCAAAVAAAPAYGSVAPSEGTLATRDGKDVVDVPLRHTEVHVRVTGIVADVTVEQTFTNPYKNKIDATYLFPLPTGAAVHELTISTGGRTIAGTLVRREDAVKRFKLARQAGHVAALLTEERPNLFTQSVANVEPGAEIKVTLGYVEALPWSDSGYELVFPMVAGPRHVPASSKLTAAAAAALQAPVLPPGLRPRTDVEVSVDLDAGAPIGALDSPSHRLALERPGFFPGDSAPLRPPLGEASRGPHRASVRLGAGDTIPNKDFILRWRLAGDAPSLGFAAHKEGDQGAFFLVAQPPAVVTAESAAPKQILFVLDTSASMAGPPLAKAKEAVRRVLADLGPDDTFQILRFDDGSSALGPRALAAKPKNIHYALDWLEALDAGGGTDMVAGIDAALAYPRDPGRLHIIAFVTDGFVGNEDEVLARLPERIGDARLFSFGVGSAVNRYLLEEMAALGRGAAEVVRPDEDTAAAVKRFEERVARPVLTDVHVDWAGLAVTDVVPARLPDLFAGKPLVVAGRYRTGGAATITVSGRLGGKEVHLPLAVTLPDREAARPEVSSLWARARIAERSRAALRGETKALETEITDLGLAYKLVTPYTAFVAVDTSRVTQGKAGETVAVAVNVPDGVDRDRGGAGDGGVLGATVGGKYETIGHGGTGVGYGTMASSDGHAEIRRAPAMDAQPSASGREEGKLGKEREPAKAIAKAADDLTLAAAMRADVQKCWLAAGKKQGARLVLHLVTAADGHVDTVTLDDADAAVAQCVAARSKSWALEPARRADAVVTVTEATP